MSRNVTEIQQRLIALGYPVGPYGADGRFGTDSLAAYNRFLASKGRPPVEGVSMAQLNRDLFPEEQPKPIIKPPKGNIVTNWFNSFVTTTAFKYLVAMAATYIATKLGLEKGSVEGILTQLIAVAMGIWGAWESSRSKIVVDGKKVSVSDLSANDKAVVRDIVALNR